MTDAEIALEKAAEKEKWDLQMQLYVCLEYIDNQCCHSAWEDFLSQQISAQAGSYDQQLLNAVQQLTGENDEPGV